MKGKKPLLAVSAVFRTDQRHLKSPIRLSTILGCMPGATPRQNPQDRMAAGWHNDVRMRLNSTSFHPTSAE
jgi:hypothetical protein